MTDSSAAPPLRSRGRLLLLLGLGLAVLGRVAYVVQFHLQSLMMPWYMPIMGLLGLVLVAASLIEKRTVWRVLALLAVGLLSAAELAFLNAVRLPPYAGPIAEGRPFPAFETKKSDGTPFTQRDLVSDHSSVMVFFRGRW